VAGHLEKEDDAMHLNLGRAVVAGLAGTAVMTLLMLLSPMMGMPPMNIGAMLGSVMGGNVALGWAAHFMIGTVLALGYAAIFASRLPGAPAVRGATFSLIPWLMAQLIVMPLMGMGLFSGSMLAAGGSLMGHLVYGLTLGVVYGADAPRLAAHQARA
jgi:uncharacterized membrane protein YagU involved in acid resistance